MRTFILLSTLLLAFSATATPASAAGVRMLVRHEVTDYAAWRKAFDAFQPTGKKMGVLSGAVYQSTDNPNDLTVIHDFKTLKAAKAFADSAELKDAMKKAGVKGEPRIWFATMTPGTSGKAAHVRMFVRHEVADYAAWRKGYDDFKATRAKLGATSQAVYRSTDDPNDLTVTHDFKSVAQAKAFADSAELKDAMKKAGVKGEPRIWFATRAVR
jgi:quinol monooxygenase YgiN